MRDTWPLLDKIPFPAIARGSLENLQVNVSLRIAPATWVRNTTTNVEVYTPGDADPLVVQMDNRHQVLTITGVINVIRLLRIDLMYSWSSTTRR